ncbi:MAG: carboxypeptidase-like regulatory domain-containing protein, partial [Gemmatimonadetes bacterium]|nr:carboxypeptidase-like regulatory domain-containing protein [Gemmatimonadota bacterium]
MRTRRVGFAFLFLLVAGVTQAFAQTRVVTGTVTHGATGRPVDQARVSVRGTPIVVLTRADGTFSIGVPAGGVELEVRRIGYSRATVSVSIAESIVNVALDADVFNLEEVIVTGRGTGIERRNLANAVSTLEGSLITRVTAQSIEHALQGKIAGADIQTNSGAPGGGAQVRLRGVTTISASNSPLYVIDGVIISNVAIASNQNAVTRAGSGSNASSTQDA